MNLSVREWEANRNEGWGEGREDFSLDWPSTGNRGGMGVSKQDAAAAAQEGPSNKLSTGGSPPRMGGRGEVVTAGAEIRTRQQVSPVQVWHTSYKEVIISQQFSALLKLGFSKKIDPTPFCKTKKKKKGRFKQRGREQKTQTEKPLFEITWTKNTMKPIS